MNTTEVAHIVDANIRARRTAKMLSSEPLPARDFHQTVDAIIAAAGWAPFHRPCASAHRGELDSIQPWRCYALDAKTCRKLSQRLIDAGDATKVPGMLAAADALIQVTWLPNPAKTPGDQLFEPTLENMEHLAGASSAVQNMLLAATARGHENYWSSGGALRDAPVYEMLGIPTGEILLGGIFLFPEITTENVKTGLGKLRDMRGPQSSWAKWVELD